MVTGIMSGALVGAGLWLAVDALIPSTPPRQIAHRDRPGHALLHTGIPDLTEPGRTGWITRLGAWINRSAAWPGPLLLTARATRDLPICGRSAHRHVGERVAAAAAGFIAPPLLALTLSTVGATLSPLWTVAALVLGPIGYLTPEWRLTAQAARRRRDARYALSAYLDLTVIGLAGGAGVEQALTQAATGTHPITTAIRRALDQATGRGQPLWTALDDLGRHLGILELRELAASLSLAGSQGARVRASLTAKATALRLRLLTDIEAHSQAATERMSLPLALMFTAFLIFAVYPALTQIADL